MGDLRNKPVYVQNADGQPLMPTTPARARRMLDQGKARIAIRSPFTIRLLQQIESPQLQPVRVGLDTGSKAMGIAAIANGKAIFVGELPLRQFQKGSAVADRAMHRRARRSRLRYRKARFLNRTRKKCKVCGGNTPKSDRKSGGRAELCRKCAAEGHHAFAGIAKVPGWISPTLKAKKDNHVHAVKNLAKILPVSEVVVEVADWDIQKIRNPDISGYEYQNGPLAHYENLRAYVYARDGWTCQYCKSEDGNLTLDHIIPESRGGPTTPNNLVAACYNCNRAKGNQTAEEWGYPDIQERVKKNELAFKHAAHVGSIKNHIIYELSKEFPVRTTYGFYTHIKRRDELGLEKRHGHDAVAIACRWGEKVEVVSPIYQGRLKPSRRRQKYQMLMFPQYRYKPRTKKGKKDLDNQLAKLKYNSKNDPERLKAIARQLRALAPEFWEGKGYFVPKERNKRIVAKDGTIFKKSDYVEAVVSGKKCRGYVTALYSSGRLKVETSEGIKSASPDRSRKLQSARSIMWWEE
ncbi:MAG: hypothetical protein D6814_00790 [Calditrichaeota bacterium]|nr:MAG: hypothetical protein D6814_00790 [Calditrichota bacterium]